MNEFTAEDKASREDRYAKLLKASLSKPKEDNWLLVKVQEFQRKEKAKQELVNEITQQVLKELLAVTKQ